MFPLILCFVFISPFCSSHTVRFAGAQKRVVGGSVIEPHRVPFQIAILNDGPHIWCSGSLVSDTIIITAAHCLFREGIPVPRENFTLVAGEHGLAEEEEVEQRRKVQKVIRHEDYDRHVGINDIAVLQSEEPFQLNEFVKTVRLADPGTKHDSSCKVSGWGYTHVKGPFDTHHSSGFPDTLRVTELNIIDRDTCTELHRELKLKYQQAAHSSTLCAGNLDGGPDSCQGDSGGPLMCPTSDGGADVVVGIVSSGIGCGLKQNPGLYTDVAQMSNWLHKTYQKLEH